MTTILQEIERTRFRLRRHKGKYREISEAAGVDYSWLHKFSRGVYSDPSAARVALLQEHLDRMDRADGLAEKPGKAA